MNIELIVVTAYVSATVALIVLSARATSGILWPTHRRKARTRRRTHKTHTERRTDHDRDATPTHNNA